MSKKHVVIIGGGFGGLTAAKALKGTDCFLDITLVDKTNHHVFQPLLYQVASAVLSPADVASPLREVLSTQKNVSVLMADIIKVDKEKKYIEFHTGRKISFDYLILAVGARHSYFGHDEWEHFAPGLKTVQDALILRERILQSFEKAERCESHEEAKKYLNFVIIGGGPTGVELAGAVAEIAHKTMIRDFRNIDTSHARIYLIEGGDRLLPPFAPDLSAKAKKALESLGVDIILSRHVTNVSKEGVEIDGKDIIPCRNVIWAAGNVASPLLKTLQMPLDRQGRLIVKPDFSLENYPNIFVIGDAACATPVGLERPLPGVAPAAIQAGKYVANIIRHNQMPAERKAFKYFDKGMMATIGKSQAVLQFRKIKMTGFLAWLAWSFIHVMYLINYRNRFLVMSEWIWTYFSKKRGVRLITRSVNHTFRKDLKEHSKN